MTLTSALTSAFSGTRQAETKIAVVSGNVTNADKPNYTRKEIETRYITVNDTTLAVGNTLQTVDYNHYLFSNLIDDHSIAAFNETLAQFLTQYSDQLGSVGQGNSLASYMDDLASAMDKLAVTPEDASLKAGVTAAAATLANELNRLTEQIQDYRQQVDQQVEQTVSQINDSLARVERLNERIQDEISIGRSTANLEDDRRAELETLSQLIDIDYFINNNNQVQIYTGNRPLLDSQIRTLDYTAASNLDRTVLYPGGIPPVTLDGVDITTLVDGGELGALIQLRDTSFTNEQARIDELANVLITQTNAVLNTGSSYPARSAITGDTTGIVGGAALGGVGTVRITTVNAQGVVQNTNDFNLAGYATIADMIADMNAVMGADITVSILGPDNELRIVADNAGEGIVIDQLTSDIGANNESFSDFFGLNNLFDGADASDIALSDYLIADPDALPTSRVLTGAIVAGDTVITPGDATLVNSMQAIFTTAAPFAAAGGFALQNESLINYSSKIISSAALAAQDANSTRDITVSLRDETSNSLSNLYAVNIDEEMAHLIDLEAQYEAAASLIAVIQELFDTLIASVR